MTRAERVRRVRTPWGRADLEVVPEGVRARPRGGLDSEEVAALLVVVAVALAVGGGLLPDPLGWLLWVPALLVLLVALVVMVVVWGAIAVGTASLVGSLVTRRGRRGLADDLRSTRRRWRQARDGVLLPATALVAPPSVGTAWLRARLVLPLADGPVAITTWWWRTDPLHRLAHHLDTLARSR